MQPKLIYRNPTREQLSLAPKLPFFYIIQHIPSGKYYAGYKVKNPDACKFMHSGASRLGYYKTSSKLVKDIIRSEGLTAFTIRRISIFDHSSNATKYESRFLRKVDAMHHKQFLNQNNGTDCSFICKGHTLETKDKLRASWTLYKRERLSRMFKGKSNLTEDGRNSITAALIGNTHARGTRHPGRHTEEGRKAIGVAVGNRLRGTKLTQEHRAKVSAALVLNNPMHNIIHRETLRKTKLGLRALTHSELPRRLAKPDSERWNALIALGYTYK